MSTNYLRDAIFTLHNRKKESATLQELVDLSGLPLSEVQRDLDLFCETGFIERLPNDEYNLKPKVLIKENITTDIPTASKAEEEGSEPKGKLETKEPVNFSKYQRVCKWVASMRKKPKLKTQNSDLGAVITIVRLAMFSIGMGAVVVSIYYTAIWMLEFLPFMLAILLSAIMVGFSVLAFGVIVLFISGRVSQHWTRWLIALCFTVLWLIVGFFSVSSTVAGQVQQHFKNNKTYALSTQSTRVDVIKWQNIQERKKELIERRNDKKQQIAKLTSLSNQVTTIEDTEKHNGVIQNASYRIQQAENTLNEIDSELDKVRTEEGKLISANPNIVSTDTNPEAPSFYSWLAKLFGLSTDLVQFILSLFPAVFVDIVAPASLAVAAFLKKVK